MKKLTGIRELLKSVLLAALFLLTIGLTLRALISDPAMLSTPAMAWAAPLRWIWGFPQQPPEVTVALETTFEPATRPVSVALRAKGVMLGASADAAGIGAFQRLLQPTLREALGTAGSPVQITREQWLKALAGPGAYIEYDLALPLDVLAAWISTDYAGGATAGRLLLSQTGGGVALLYEDAQNGLLYRCDTAAAAAWPDWDELPDAKPCFFAFEQPDQYPTVPSDAFLMADAPVLPSAAATTVDATLYTAQFLRALEMEQGAHYTEADGTRVYVDSLRACRFSPDGVIDYQTLDEQEMAMFAASDTTAAHVEMARGLLATLSPALGSAEFQLSEVRGQTVFTFSLWLHGAPVFDGSSATVEIENGVIVRADILLRQYTLTDESIPLLPVRQAAALLPAGTLPGVSYAADGGAYKPSWYARRRN